MRISVHHHRLEIIEPYSKCRNENEGFSLTSSHEDDHGRRIVHLRICSRLSRRPLRPSRASLRGKLCREVDRHQYYMQSSPRVWWNRPVRSGLYAEAKARTQVVWMKMGRQNRTSGMELTSSSIIVLGLHGHAGLISPCGRSPGPQGDHRLVRALRQRCGPRLWVASTLR